MLQVMDITETYSVFYINVGMFTSCEQSTISLLTVNNMGIVRPTVQHDMIGVSVSYNVPGII